MKCPACKNGYHRGFGYPGFIPMEIPCDICNGTTVLPENISYDPERGKNLKDARMSQRITLREICKKTGQNIVERCKNERGFFKNEEK